MTKEQVFDKMKGAVVPVLVIANEQEADKTAKLMVEKGVYFAEVTYRNNFAGQAIKYFSDNFEDIVTGAGTVINIEQARDAVSKGAKFIVSPGFDIEVSKECNKLGVLYIPGVETATEIMAAIKAGHNFLKFFPAEAACGVAKLKALAAPFPNLKFMPTGGINARNQKDYFELSCVHCVGGSYLLKEDK